MERLKKSSKSGSSRSLSTPVTGLPTTPGIMDTHEEDTIFIEEENEGI